MTDQSEEITEAEQLALTGDAEQLSFAGRAELIPPGNNVPGQAVSIAALKFLKLTLDSGIYPWSQDFKLLIKRGWNWRVAVIIAWSAMDPELQYPKTKKELAATVLHCSTRTITNHLKKEAVQAEIGLMKAEPWLKHRHQIMTEVIPAAIESATLIGKEGHPDRKMVLTAAGLLEPEPAVSVTAQAGVIQATNLEQLPNDELTILLDNLIIAEASQRANGLPIDEPTDE